MVWLIILAILVLLILPLGADLSYFDGVFAFKLKLGPLRLTLFPRAPRPEKPKKPKKPKPPKPEGEAAEKPKPSFPKLTLDDILELLGILFRLLGRFRRYLSIDDFTLHLVCGGEDPYDAVLLYGRLNAALGALSPWFHRAFRVRAEDLRLGTDVTPGAATAFEGRLVFSWQLWELLHTVNCAALSALRWYLRKRRAQRAETKRTQLIEQKG